MANTVSNVFKDQLLKGNHNFQSGGNTYKVGLYTSSRTAAATDTGYDTTNESSGISNGMFLTSSMDSRNASFLLRMHFVTFLSIHGKLSYRRCWNVIYKFPTFTSHECFCGSVRLLVIIYWFLPWRHCPILHEYTTCLT